MKKVQVLGPGCPKCVELAKRTAEAAEALGGDFEVEKVSELSKIMAFGIFTTPALAHRKEACSDEADQDPRRRR